MRHSGWMSLRAGANNATSATGLVLLLVLLLFCMQLPLWQLWPFLLLLLLFCMLRSRRSVTLSLVLSLETLAGCPI